MSKNIIYVSFSVHLFPVLLDIEELNYWSYDTYFSENMPNFSKQATPVYLAISNARGLCPLHIFTIALSTIMGMKYLLVILICVFLMTNDDERLFVRLLALVYFLWKNVYSDQLFILKLVIFPHFKFFCLFWILDS